MLKMLREESDYADARIVALTASVMNEEVTLLRERGFDSIIAKPINVSSFPKLLERLVQGESVWHVGD
jgi:CheY-like chemotaxis protein